MKNKKYTIRELILKFIPYYGNYKFLFVTDMIAAVLTIVAEISLPLIIRSITNKATINIASLSMKFILHMGGLYIALKIIEILATFYMQKYGHIMGASIEKDMRRTVFSHIQYLSDEFYAKNKIGNLLSRVTNDLFEVTEFAHHCPEEFLVAAVKVIATFIILANINLTLTFIIFFMLPLMLVFTNKTRKKIRSTQMAQRYQIGEINSSIEDSLLGIKVIRSFANEEIEIEQFDQSNKKFLGIKKEFYQSMAEFTATTKILDALMYITVVIFGGYFIIKGKINSGDFILYTMYTTTLLASVSRLINFIEVFEKGISGIERYLQIMDEEPSIKNSENPIFLNK
ncbi:MAG: ABC transporter ATP-binding protein, partial [Helcococcus sp.]|nr:ABC transporter ATP-binding protein [Helcococcus sp.]